jgi:polysaccharide pyruvyl transferase WcaK-like protein
LTEWDGPWGFLYTIFAWVLLARLANVKCIFLNVGAGPLTRPLSKWFARRSLSLAAYVSFRDQDSRRLVQRIGFSGACRVFPDSAHSLDIPAAESSRFVQESRQTNRRRRADALLRSSRVPRKGPGRLRCLHSETCRVLPRGSSSMSIP